MYMCVYVCLCVVTTKQLELAFKLGLRNKQLLVNVNGGCNLFRFTAVAVSGGKLRGHMSLSQNF